MAIYLINKKIKIKKILRTIKIHRAKMLFNKCNNNLPSKEEKISLREKDF
jgi:hypothetical protein